MCDAGDTDDDNDGALDGADSNDNNPFICSDNDNDTCDDCSSGLNRSDEDGLDTDGDGLCDAGDDCIYHEPNDPDQNSFCGTDPVLSFIGQQSTLEDNTFTIQLGSS